MTVGPQAVRLLAAVLIAGLVGAACTSREADPDPDPTGSPGVNGPSPQADRRGGTLRLALQSDPAGIDPVHLADEYGELVADALFDSLVALDGDLQPIPAAASSWEMNDEGTEFTFTLNTDATFHDGSPVTAEDVVRGLNMIADGTLDRPSFAAFQLTAVQGFEEAQANGEALSGLEATDASTVVIRLQYPFPEFVLALADPALAPVPAAALEDPEAFALQPIGNGPFAMAEPWQKGQYIRVARYEDYAPEPALLDEVLFSIYTDDVSLERQWEDLVNDQVHVAQIPAARIEEAEDRFGTSPDGFSGPGFLGGTTGTIYYFGFNTERAPFDRPEVRRAISLVIDREAISAEIMQGSRLPADAIVPPSIPGSQESPCDNCAFNPEAAVQLLEEAGGAELFDGPIVLLHNDGRTHQAIAEQVSEAIGEHLGLEVTVESLALDPYLGELRRGDMDIFRLGWTATYPSADSYLFPLFHASAKGRDNLSRFNDLEISDRLTTARAELDRETRVGLYQEIETDVLGAAPIAPVLFYRQMVAVGERVRDLRMDPMGAIDFVRVWLDE